ncbi:MAG: hypothetical protein ACKVOQ_01410 [Cyclobacteriaceae bacterium]
MAKNFELGMKVSLNGEKRVIVNSNLREINSYGVICWDTNRESDSEDWRGLFGSFKDDGGMIIESDYEFKFINDDGTLKTVNKK